MLTFSAEYQHKIYRFEAKTMPKQLLNSSKPTFKHPWKPQKTGFLTLKMVKIPSQRAKFWPKILILDVICPLFFSSRDIKSNPCHFDFQKLALWEGHFDHFGVQKSRFLDFLIVVLEMFRRCLGIVFGLKRLSVRRIFSSKGRYMTPKIKILGQNLGLWEGHFDHFQGQKTRFLDFLKVGLE